MNVIKITDERIDAILPKHIKDSEVLDKNDKKVLGAILHYFLVLDKAKENKYVILTNEDLRKTICIRKASVLTSVQNLIELGLIKRECGKTWTEGEKPQASKYYIIWDNIKKPIRKPKFEDLFLDFLSSETPLGTIDTDIDTDIDKEIEKDIAIASVDNVTKDTLQISGVMYNEDIPNEDKSDDALPLLNDFIYFENERSDGRNDCNEQQSKGEATLRDAERKTITSTLENKNLTSTDYHNVPVETPKDKKFPPNPPTTKDIEAKINGNAGAWNNFFNKLFDESA